MRLRSQGGPIGSGFGSVRVVLCLLAPGLLALVMLGSAPVAAGGAGFPFKSPTAAAVHDFRRCLTKLPAGQRRLLVLRSGIGARPILTPAQVASVRGISLAQEQSRENAAVARLRQLGQQTRCAPGPRSPAPAPSRTPAPAGSSHVAPARSPTTLPGGNPSAATPAAPAGHFTSTGSGSDSGWTRPEPLIALVVAMLALAGVLFEVVRVVRDD